MAEPIERMRDDDVDPAALLRADERVAARFSRVMNATTSPLGQISDPPLVAIATAVFFIIFLAQLRAEASPAVVQALAALAALPVVIAIGISLSLLGARKRVVAWMDGLPFPVDNMNALLNGLGDSLEIVFRDSQPDAPTLNRVLETISEDTFVTLATEATRTIDVRVGVVDSKRNPARTNHQRYQRVQAIVDRALIALHAEHPIAIVRVK